MKRFFLAAAATSLLVTPAPASAKRLNLTMNFGQDVLIAENGAVALRAQCLANEGGLDILRVYATTTSPAVLRGHANYPGAGSFLTPASVPAASQVVQSVVTTGLEGFNAGFDGGFVLNVATQEGITVRNETVLLGINSGDDDCLLSLDLTPVKKFKEAK